MRNFSDCVAGWTISFATVDQKETGTVLVDRDVAEGRGLEEELSADHWRGAEELLCDLVARPGHLVVLPLRLHIVDAALRPPPRFADAKPAWVRFSVPAPPRGDLP